MGFMDWHRGRAITRTLLDTFWQFQKDRCRLESQIRAIMQGADDSTDPAQRALLEKYLTQFAETEKSLRSDVIGLVKGVHIVEDLVELKGIDYFSAAKLYVLINIFRSDTVSKLWRFSGYAPVLWAREAEKNKDGKYAKYPYTQDSDVLTTKKEAFGGKTVEALIKAKKVTPCEPDEWMHSQVVDEGGKKYTYHTEKNRLFVSVPRFGEGVSVGQLIKDGKLVALGRSAERAVAGEVLHYNARLKVTMHQIAESLIRTGDGYHYRRVYDEARAKYDKKEDWPKGRCYFAALRIVKKVFLAHLWEQWRTHEGLPTRELYVIEKLGHTMKWRRADFGWPVHGDAGRLAAK